MAVEQPAAAAEPAFPVASPQAVTDAPPPIPEPPREEPGLAPAPWKWWESLIVFAMAIATSIVLQGIVVATLGKGDVGTSVAIVAFEFALGFWAVMWVKVRFGLGFSALGLTGDRLGENIAIGVGAGLAGIVLATLVVGQIVFRIVQALSDKVVRAPEQLHFHQPSGAVLAITGVGVIVAAPFAEELFFRGFMFRGFRRSFSLVPAALISGALFGLAHAPYWLIIPSIATLGIILAVTFDMRRSVVPTIVAHAVFNSIGFVAYLVTLRR